MEQDKSYTLINRYLSGELADSERREFEIWLNESELNRRTLAKMQKVWSHTASWEPDSVPDFDQSWSRLASKIGLPENPVSTPKTASGRRYSSAMSRRAWGWAGVAAAAGFAVLISYRLFLKPSWQTYETRLAEKREVILPDQSMVRLNADSQIRLSYGLNDSVRIVFLTGQAFFDVVTESRPFVVQTNNARIRVLGTSFDIWAREGRTQVVVKEGQVAFSSLVGDSLNTVLLKAGEKSSAMEGESPVSPESVDPEFLLGWLNNRFVFHKTPLREVIAEMERRYDVTIELASAHLGSLSMSGAFEEQSIDSTLASFCLTLNLTYQYDGTSYLISE